MKKLQVLFLFIILLDNKMDAQAASCLNFDGTDDHVSIGHFSRPANMTIEAWIKTSSQGTGQIVGWAGTTYNSAEFKIAGGNLVYYEWDNVNWIGVAALENVTDGIWHHVAVVRTAAVSNNITIYVDGNVSNAGTVNLNIATNALNIGAYNYISLQQFFEGEMDEVRIWNRALCAAEIQNNMNAELPPGQIGLKRYYKFNQGLAAANNAGITILADASPDAGNGILSGFALAGASSNWVAPSAITSGSTSPAFTGGVLITGAAALCSGQTLTLSATGAVSYSWNSGITTSSIVVSPTVTTLYSVLGAADANGCAGTRAVSVIVDLCTGIAAGQRNSGKLVLYPNPGNGEFILECGTDLNKTLRIYNTMGLLLYTATISEERTLLDLTEYENGCYFLRVSSGSFTETLQIIKH